MPGDFSTVAGAKTLDLGAREIAVRARKLEVEVDRRRHRLPSLAYLYQRSTPLLPATAGKPADQPPVGRDHDRVFVLSQRQIKAVIDRVTQLRRDRHGASRERREGEEPAEKRGGDAAVDGRLPDRNRLRSLRTGSKRHLRPLP